MAIRGESEREYQAIMRGAGFCHLTDRQLIRIVGDDRVSFLHGMCTADIKGLKTGDVAPALFVTEHSHVIAECFVYALPDTLILEVERERWEQIRAHLEKFLVADDVEMEELDWSVIDLEGPVAAVEVASQFGSTPPTENWRFDPDRMIAHFPRYGAPSFSLLTDPSKSDEALSALRSRESLTELTPATLDLLRIEKGIARVGVDTTEKTLALEAAFEFAISYNKGCYIGQETIERATARGGLKRKLCGLQITGDTAPVAGAPIKLDDKVIGNLTSIARSPELGVIGLAILHHSAWNDGTAVSIEGAMPITATVSRLPFAKA